MLTDTKKSPYAKVHGLPFGAVKLQAGFWKDCLEMCTYGMVGQIQRLFESREISHVVENFRICAGDSEGVHHGTPFGDGDFYKWLEAVLYCGVSNQDESLLEQLDSYIRLIARAQRPDGYLSTKQIINEMNGGPGIRQKDINEFEVYNFGHLFTLASLHKRLTGSDTLVRVAEKTAGYLETLYEQAEAGGQAQTAVCPSHYMGLVELYRATKEERYLRLAEKAMELRDRVENGLDDNQDRLPLKQHEKILGHAVRANYLYAGLADLYAETGNETWFLVLKRVWNSLVNKKLYITGGCGALYNGASPYGNFFAHQKIHQAYGYEYQLPNITAYNETCASIGGVMWAYRMFTADPKAEYMDVLERMMYNVNLAAVSLDGKRYFYENMLRRTRKLDFELVWPRERTEYIKSFCCPPNLARLLSQISEYAYTVSYNQVYIGLYGASDTQIQLENGAEFRMVQETDYPYDGTVRFRFTQVAKECPWKLMIRVPAWAKKGRILVNGKEGILTKEHAGTYQTVEIPVTGGTVVEVFFEMEARLTIANSMVEEAENHVAVERGPLVYCMESPDAPVETLDDLAVPAEAEFMPEPFEIGGRKFTALVSEFVCIEKEDYDSSALYQTLKKTVRSKKKVRLIPYFAWDNRGMGEMRIWFPISWQERSI